MEVSLAHTAGQIYAQNYERSIKNFELSIFEIMNYLFKKAIDTTFLSVSHSIFLHRRLLKQQNAVPSILIFDLFFAGVKKQSARNT